MKQNENIHIENHPDYKGLKVNAGIDQPPAINPNGIRGKVKKRPLLSADDYLKGILHGDRAVLSRAVTLVESVKPEHHELAQEIIMRCLPYSGKSIRVGITGVPGAGKSTFIEALGKHITSQQGKLAVLAIDPSSERSKGSILGDKTRMEELANNPNAYIRPSPSAGSLGGVARKTRETVILCEAAGFDNIFIETVGVGQSETAVHSMVDFFLLLQIAGAGDELQGIKRGIMEMADGIVINKADGTNIDKAELARVQFANALHLFPLSPSGWVPKVMKCSSKTSEGIENVWKMVIEYLSFVQENGFFDTRRNQQAKYWMYESIDQYLKSSFYGHIGIKNEIKRIEDAVLNQKMSSFVAANELLKIYFRSK
ncbi:MAG: methylmalonyl Co-A mutase-associated GTPase MeaB [Prolixibacteraceae bacterium]|nr:methylmalonyl Co-A mutase-associated GTPase MeaB [Prolixibacteraceae bacterium]